MIRNLVVSANRSGRMTVSDNASSKSKAKMKILITAATITIMAAESFSQNKVKPLSIGDKLPDIEISHLVNTAQKKAKLSSFRGKFIIIDFWSIGCASCIEALPKLQALQNKHKDRLQVITAVQPSSYHTKEGVSKAYTRYTKDEFSLMTTLNNTPLVQYFPHKFISHVIWIDSEGVVRAITGSEHINEQYMKDFFANKTVNWPVKQDAIDFNNKIPMLDFSNQSEDPKFFYYSSFAGPVYGVNFGSIIADSTKGTWTRNEYNVSLLDLCKGTQNAELGGDPDTTNVIFNVKDRQRYTNESSGGWVGKGYNDNRYSYSVVLPLSLSEDERNNYMARDIERWLELTLDIIIKKEMRPAECLILKLIPGHFTASKANFQDATIKSDEKEFKLICQPLRELINALRNGDHIGDGFPFVMNETGLEISQMIDISINKSAFKNVEVLNEELMKYGFTVGIGIRPVEMLVITEKEWLRERESIKYNLHISKH